MLMKNACLVSVALGLCATTLQSATLVPASGFTTADTNLEVVVFATSPQIKNPTNLDVDQAGRIWVAEGVNYRRHYDRQPAGDRIMVLEDADGDGKAEKSHVFVQEPFLRAPMGIAVLDNKVVVSMAPDIVIYTDVDRDGVFDPTKDKREVLLHGFNGRVHDHTVHSVTAGPDGLWYWNAGNCGAMFTDTSGKTFRIGSNYDPYYGSKPAGDLGWDPREIAGKPSDDGHVWVGGFAARMRPDGSRVEIIGHNFRNSYEQVITSYGDVFQNDNDDPPACRTTFLLEYGNAGFCSFDGKRSWGADRRPGQSVPTAEWRQEDPGTMPAGDVYGGGSPTGIAYVEDSALGKDARGLLLSCEPGRNVVFGYYPKPEGAGFKLERFDFLTSNREGEFAGGDFKGGDGSVSRELKTYFRPSDVVVGADGAIYVADFFDPRVGGHNDMDETTSGTIYRIAPKGFKSRVPKLDVSKTRGQVEALRSYASNVRNLGFTRLVSAGEASIKPVLRLLKDENPYVQARAVWVLANLGSKGIDEVRRLFDHPDPQFRIVAFRALRRVGQSWLPTALALTRDPSPAVRREVALAMRDIPFSQSGAILVDLARRYDGKDATYLEAWGTGCFGKEKEVLLVLEKSLGQSDPLKWTPAYARMAWRLHLERSIPDFKARALSTALSDQERKASIVAIGYNTNLAAAQAMLEIAAGTDKMVKAEALWWLLNRKDNQWKPHNLGPILKERGIYDPEKVELVAIATPEPPKTSSLPPIATIVAMKGDAARGEQLATACQVCHRIGNKGVEYAPNLTGWARRQTTEVLLQSIINPSADIAQGFGGTEITTKDGLVIHGVVMSDGDPLVVQSQGGIVQTVPASRIASRKGLKRSLMLSAEQMGLAAQDLADLVAYLRGQ